MKIILLSLSFLLIIACGKTEKIYTPIDGDAVILAFGDSLTYGTGTDENSSYPAVLERLTGHEVINEGIPGELSQAGLKRLPALLDEHQPQLLILIHGGNDIIKKISSTQIVANLKQMIALTKEQNIKVIMLGVPSFSILSLESAALYEQVAEDNNIPINLDILPEILSDNSLKSDQIHPNKKGYKLMAEAVYQLLIESGAISQPSSNN